MKKETFFDYLIGLIFLVIIVVGLFAAASVEEEKVKSAETYIELQKQEIEILKEIELKIN